jgi:hypothetical protein
MPQNQLKWTIVDKQYIVSNFHNMTDKDFADYFSKMKGVPVGIESVRKVRQRLKLKKPGGPPPRKII